MTEPKTLYRKETWELCRLTGGKRHESHPLHEGGTSRRTFRIALLNLLMHYRRLDVWDFDSAGSRIADWSTWDIERTQYKIRSNLENSRTYHANQWCIIFDDPHIQVVAPKCRIPIARRQSSMMTTSKSMMRSWSNTFSKCKNEYLRFIRPMYFIQSIRKSHVKNGERNTYEKRGAHKRKRGATPK